MTVQSDADLDYTVDALPLGQAEINEQARVLTYAQRLADPRYQKALAKAMKFAGLDTVPAAAGEGLYIQVRDEDDPSTVQKVYEHRVFELQRKVEREVFGAKNAMVTTETLNQGPRAQCFRCWEFLEHGEMAVADVEGHMVCQSCAAGGSREEQRLAKLSRKSRGRQPR